MEQVIIGGKYNLLDVSATEYNLVHGGNLWAAVENQVRQVITTGGKIKNLRIVLDGSPGSGKSYAFVILINGSPAGCPTVTISNLETSGADVSTEKVVSAGDIITMRCIPSGTPTARYATWTLMFEGDNANESLLLGGNTTTISKTATSYNSVSGGNTFWRTEELSAQQVIPTGGVIKNLYVSLNVDPGTSPDAYRFTLRLDTGGGFSSTALTTTITADATTGNDTANDITVAAGDVVTLMGEPLNTPSATPFVAWGFTFVADTDGESLIMGGEWSALHTTNTQYNSLFPVNDIGWHLTEAQRIQLAQTCVLKKFYVQLSAEPGSGKNFVFTVRRNETSPASGLVVTIASFDTTGNDVSNDITVADDDTLDLECNPDATPTSGRTAYWGLVGYIAPSVTAAPGGSPLAQMIQAGLV